MQAEMENENVNKILAQIHSAIKENRITYRNNTKWILDKIPINNINFQVVATDYLVSQKSEWIGYTALHFAVEEGKPEAFDVLLNHGADFTLRNSNNATVLHQVVEKYIPDISEVLTLNDTFVNSVLSAHLKYNNFENPWNNNELSHFHIACAANNVEVVRGFRQSRVLINHAVEMDSLLFPGFTSLHFAAKYCASEAVDLLLIYGANVLIKDAKGMTPLHIALERKLKLSSDVTANETLKDTNDQILQMLNQQSNSHAVLADDWGLSNFHVSCALKDSTLAERLLPKVVNINHHVNMDSPFWPGYTALHFAAMCNVDLVRLLIKRGADMNFKNAKGVTPLDICLERHDGKVNLPILSMNTMICIQKLNLNITCGLSLWPCSPMHFAVMLAKNSGEPAQMNLPSLRNLHQQNLGMIYIQDLQGRTPLHLAFRLNKNPVIDLLLDLLKECPNLVDRVDEDGLSLLHIATAKNQTALIERLLSVGANVNNVYRGKFPFSPMIYSGSTALHIAVLHGSAEAVEILMNHGANVCAQDVNGMTPIHTKFLSTKKKMTNLLLSSPSLTESTVSGIGLSHLHVASHCRKPNALKMLLDKGADVNGRITRPQNVNADTIVSSFLESYVGYSPLIIAYKRFNFTNVELLLQHGADIFVEYKRGLALVYHILENCGYCLDKFVQTVKESETLMTRVKAETGMTPLHFVCFERNTEVIEKLLSEGADINAQIPTYSPILKGYTPLHILMHVSAYYYARADVIKVIELFFKAGADVTLQNAKLETAVHIAYNFLFPDDPDDDEGPDVDKCYSYMNTLIEAQQDFSVNPTDINGTSHFHIACYICNTGIVEKFLDYDEIDINQQTHYFSHRKSGYSALHFAVGSNNYMCKIVRQLDTVGLLLDHGADIHAEDSYGETPFHVCARYNSLDLFERLLRSGGDVNSRNICGDTPLYFYLKSENVSFEGLKILIRFGCRLNTYNVVTHRGYLGKTLNVPSSHKKMRNFFFVLIENFEQEMRMDDFGRTAIHNIVSIGPPDIPINVYVELIEQLSRVNCDIDDQDNLGRTALHMAVKFRNYKAISGLLLAGADVNRIDINGKTALAGDFDSCKNYGVIDEKNKTTCKHFETLKILAIHVKKLQLCGLDVNKQNEEFASEAFKKFKNDTAMTEKFFKELETIKNTELGSHSLILHDLLSEYGIVVSYPRMLDLKRNDVNEFFSSGKIQKVRKQFPELAEVLQLQYRKAKVRSKLMELAKDALAIFAGYRLPEICSEYILILLKNSELENLITSAILTEVEIVNKF